jgi:hypothetical protein
MAVCITSRLVPQAHTQRHVEGFRSGIFSMSAQRPNLLPGTGGSFFMTSLSSCYFWMQKPTA